ncbi:hypothetical protein MMC32_006657 [Xylographa parallela]|nr:hypothetical protein [Xylographa parallela]
MIAYMNSTLRATAANPLLKEPQSIRPRTTRARAPKKEGDISSVFVSLSGAAPTPLADRFAAIKRQLITGHEDAIRASWQRLLERLIVENAEIAQQGPGIIPQIDFSNLSNPSQDFLQAVKKRGVAVVRGVVPESEARGYKTLVDEYIKTNPGTKGMLVLITNPAVFELYWSPSQVRARAHPNLISAQRFLMNLWHSDNEEALISTSQPLSYADRVRIRQPGDSDFALGPHIDGGSLERWEPEGYGLGSVYDKIWQGEWENYNPWEPTSRVSAVSDLYNGGGACSMFRMFQGWLSMSSTGPKEGTLLVNPLLQLSTAYLLLRPFFAPIKQLDTSNSSESMTEYLRGDNWTLQTGKEITSDLQGANPGQAQELSQVLHPHLDLARTMVHIPQIKAGDYVVWHCDTIHAVDKIHEGKSDSSVLYIPVCPVTETNAEYLARQRDAFLSGLPGPDFPGGKGESEHIGRPTIDYLSKHAQKEGMQAMGLESLSTTGREDTFGGKIAIERANAILAL